MMQQERCDLLVVGGGVIGCATLRACLQAHPSLDCILLEAEPELAMHQSGRNSGVIHAGYNQKPGTQKAKYVVEGNKRLREYCRAKAVPILEDGILIVARNETEIATLNELHERGKQNGARVEIIGPDDLKAREPHAVGLAALYAPDGCSFDSRGYVLTLAAEARDMGAKISLGEPVIGIIENSDGVVVQTNQRRITAKVAVVAAGLQADKIAHMMGLRKDLFVVPFRGEYHELTEAKRYLVRTHLYPAPDLNFPFLGVHFSRTFDQHVMMGPGAMLSFSRKNYSRLAMDPEVITQLVTSKGFWKLALSSQFRTTAKQEWRKSLFSQSVAAEGRQLVPELQNGDIIRAKSGMRAQLVSNEGKLVDDLIVEETDRTIHVLNAVSPALTCSLPFADSLAASVSEKMKKHPIADRHGMPSPQI